MTWQNNFRQAARLLRYGWLNSVHTPQCLFATEQPDDGGMFEGLTFPAFWPHKELDHDTEAFTLLFGQPKASGPTILDADAWIDHRSSGRYTICEHSIRIGPDVLALLWWKDESQILDCWKC